MNALEQQFEWLSELNERQREAVTHGEGPLIVVAGAGSGKTRTLAYRVAFLIGRGVPPYRILLLTFTRRAAEEMLKRAAAIVSRGIEARGQVWGGTFHSIAYRLLRKFANSAGLNPEFTVMDRGDAEDMMGAIRHDLGLSSKEKRFPKKTTCVDVYSRCVNGSDSLEDVLERHFSWCGDWEEELRRMFREYVAQKQKLNLLDYDDLLLYWLQLLRDERLAEHIGGMFDHVLVDEYQDTNVIQSDILRGMRRFNRNIMVVGDDAQSIYSFRAATVRNMLDFPKHFPDSRVVTLEQNYRSVMPILETTNLMIAHARERYTKDLWSDRVKGERPKLVACQDDTAQDDYLVARILEHHEKGIPLRKQAVLFRTGYLSGSLEVELARRKIPFRKYGGLRFIEAAHIKDVLSFVRIAENPRDEIAWLRALQLMSGIGGVSARRAIAHVASNRNDPRSIRSFRGPLSSAEDLKGFSDLIDLLMAPGDLPPVEQVRRIRAFYQPIMMVVHENPQVRARDLDNLERIAERYRSRKSFLVDLMLDPPTSTSDLASHASKDEDWLVLSTIHSAKGCEWDAVYLMHASDGCLPSDLAAGSDDEIEEELRLAYVAMTRARDHLYVTWPIRYYHKRSRFTDMYNHAMVSRFITREVMATFDKVSVGGSGTEDAVSDLDFMCDAPSAVRGMWE